MTESEQKFIRNKNAILERIAVSANRAGRKPEEVKLMAVTKLFPQSIVQMAFDNGITLFGENRVQEAAHKFQTFNDKNSIELHLIGHLQRNKASMAARTFSWVQSIDKLETAVQLNKYALIEHKRINILLEMNTSGEVSKFGFLKESLLLECLDKIKELDNLCIRGLMTVGPFTDDKNRIRSAFTRLRKLYEKAKDTFPDLKIDTLSMGMSYDFEMAVEQGATLVRIGSALFGSRERTV